MSLDGLMDKLADVRVTIGDRDEAKQWLFEYGCKVSEGYGLKPKTNVGFVKYCATHKLAKTYKDAMYAHEDPSWSGLDLNFKVNEFALNKIGKTVSREFRQGTLPSHSEYRTMVENGATQPREYLAWTEGK